MAADQLK